MATTESGSVALKESQWTYSTSRPPGTGYIGHVLYLSFVVSLVTCMWRSVGNGFAQGEPGMELAYL